MKKILFSTLIIFVLFFIIGCNYKNSKQSIILKNIEIDNNKCEIEKDEDTHSGFLGDGDYFAKIKCTDINYNELSKNWKKLPLSNSLKEVIQMEQCNGDGCNNVYEKFSIPNTENGYYYFLDRHSESTNKFDDTDLNNRSSWNFTLAIIDETTNIIYYYELDT